MFSVSNRSQSSHFLPCSDLISSADLRTSISNASAAKSQSQSATKSSRRSQDGSIVPVRSQENNCSAGRTCRRSTQPYLGSSTQFTSFPTIDSVAFLQQRRSRYHFSLYTVSTLPRYKRQYWHSQVSFKLESTLPRHYVAK